MILIKQMSRHFDLRNVGHINKNKIKKVRGKYSVYHRNSEIAVL